jgi:large subunit ribosomal protein L32e
MAEAKKTKKAVEKKAATAKAEKTTVKKTKAASKKSKPEEKTKPSPKKTPPSAEAKKPKAKPEKAVEKPKKETAPKTKTKKTPSKEHSKAKVEELRQEGTSEPGQETGTKTREKPKKPRVKKEFPITKIENVPDPDKAPSKDWKPNFKRQEHWKFPKLEDKWRRPRGIDSKQHEKKRGKGELPAIGYKKPPVQRDKHAGYAAVRVFNAKELEGVNPKNQAIIIASQVGRKKRNQIIKEANMQKITILNPRRGEV